MGRGRQPKTINPLKAKAAQARQTKDVTASYQFRTVQDLEALHLRQPNVGFICIYQTFENTTSDTYFEMGKAVNDTMMNTLGQRVTSGQGTKIAADDSRAIPILAEKYGFGDPKCARGKYFKTDAQDYPENTEVILIIKESDTTSKDYFPEEGCVEGEAFFWDPDMGSKEFHCIYGEKKARDIEWTDVQRKFPDGPRDNHSVAWFTKKPTKE